MSELCHKIFKQKHCRGICYSWRKKTAIRNKNGTHYTYDSKNESQSNKVILQNNDHEPKCRILDFKSKPKKGSISIWILSSFCILFSILIVTLKIQRGTYDYLKNQRKIDQCLFSLIRQRCIQINSISKSNYLLENIQNAALLIQSGKILALTIPGLQGTFVAGEETLKFLRATAFKIKQMQDKIIDWSSALEYRLYFCGMPNKNNNMNFLRKTTWKNQITKIPDPLIWINSVEKGYLELLDPHTGYVSFGHCQLNLPLGNLKSKQLLLGEEYMISLTKPR